MSNTTKTDDDFSSLIGNLYARWTLDCLIEIGYAISIDLITRPQLYQGDDIPDAIVQFRMSYGTDARFPNTVQRQAMMMPIFGKSDGLKTDANNALWSFPVARKKLIDACIAFSERAVDTGVSMLEDRVRSALIPLRAHFEGLRGKSVRLSDQQQMAVVSKTAVGILQAPSVARVFSATPATAEWPFRSNDVNGAKLVDTASSVLALPPDYKHSATKFILLQRVAQEGGRALPQALNADASSTEQLHSLISQCYTWGTSLRDFQQMS